MISEQTKNKATLTFIALKLLEIGSIFGLTFGIYYLGILFEKLGLREAFLPGLFEGKFEIWLSGLLFIVIIIVALFVGFYVLTAVWALLEGFIKLNWKWAIMLNETPKERKEREKVEEKERKIKEEKRNEERREKLMIEDEETKKQRKKYGFAVGDVVKVKKKLDVEKIYGHRKFQDWMKKYLGETKQLRRIDSDGDIYLLECEWGSTWSKELLEIIGKKKK